MGGASSWISVPTLLAPVRPRWARWNDAEQSVYVWRIMMSQVVPSERGIVAIRPSGNQTAQCPTESNNGVLYKIYILFTSIYNTSLFSSSSVDSSTSQHRLPDVQLPRHSAVSSSPSYFLAPPTPPFPLNPCPRRQRPRRHCVAPTPARRLDKT